MIAVLMAALLTAQRTADPPRSAASSVTWRTPIEVAAGDAIVGPWRMNASQWNYVDDPTVSIDQERVVAVAWVDQSRKDIFFQLYDLDGRARPDRPVNVSKSPGVFSWLPRIAITSGPPRHVYVLWQEIVFSGGSHGGEIFFARSTDDGRSFSRPINLSNTPAGDGKGRLTRDFWHNGSLDLALGPGGALYAAWTEYEGTLWFSRSTDEGATFSPPIRVAGGRTDPARGPSLAVHTEGRVYLVWTIGEDPRADIRLATSSDGGRSFGEPQVLFRSPGHADAPKVAVDGKGVVHVVYAESPSGPLGQYHIQYARSTDGGRTFEAQREIPSLPTREFESASFPSLSVDTRGNVYVLWELFPDVQGRARGLGFAYSRDGRQTFSSPSLVPGTGDSASGVNGSLQGSLMRKLAANGAGAIAVVNSTFRKNRDSRVWLLLGRVAGH
jgi:hypothetical protein